MKIAKAIAKDFWSFGPGSVFHLSYKGHPEELLVTGTRGEIVASRKILLITKTLYTVKGPLSKMEEEKMRILYNNPTIVFRYRNDAVWPNCDLCRKDLPHLFNFLEKIGVEIKQEL